VGTGVGAGIDVAEGGAVGVGWGADVAVGLAPPQAKPVTAIRAMSPTTANCPKAISS
jgi:hypothetical protein